MNNRQYIGTRGLSLAVVAGAAVGTVIGKLMDNMRTGLMIGLVLAVCVWTLLTQSRAKAANLPEEAPPETRGREAEEKDRGGQGKEE